MERRDVQHDSQTRQMGIQHGMEVLFSSGFSVLILHYTPEGMAEDEFLGITGVLDSHHSHVLDKPSHNNVPYSTPGQPQRINHWAGKLDVELTKTSAAPTVICNIMLKVYDLWDPRQNTSMKVLTSCLSSSP